MKKTDTVFNVVEFGAIPDGKTMCTEAFAAAVKAAREAGGGAVYVPAGVFLSGPIHLESDITLYLDAGSRILFSQNPEDYPLVDSRWEGENREVYSPLIYGKGLENVAVIGRGVLDGQGEPWWKWHREKSLAYPRPRFICFENSNNVLIEGIKLINSPAWTINPINCENLTIDKVTITNPADSPNTDGINPESCKNVHISNCHIDVGDDCIAIKSGIEKCKDKIPCENITITNCTMVHGHGGVVIGSEMSGGVRNVVISNCIFEGTDRGIRLKSRRGRGGVIEDIRVDNIIMKRVICPFVLNLYYFCGEGGKEKVVWDKNPYPVTEATPCFRRIHFSNITAREITASAGFMYGLPEMLLEEITFDNISVHLAEDGEPAVPAMMSHLDPMKQQGFFCCNVKNVFFNKVNVSGHAGPAFEVKQSQDIEFSRCSDQGRPDQPLILMEEVERGIVEGCKRADGKGVVLELKGAGNRDIEFTGNQERVKLTEGAVLTSIS